jgi:flagellar basal body-associated protein FliL
MSEPAAKPAAVPDGPKPGLLGKFTIVLLLLAILGGEALMAFLFLPSADEVAAAGRPSAEAHGDSHGHEELPGLEHEVSEGSLRELDLEKYALTIPNMKTGTSYRVDFHLWGVIAAEHEKEFEHLYEEHKHRLRDQIGTIIRRAEPAELAEPGLGLIKRAISTKVNQTLGKPVLHGVVFSEFVFYEQ